MTRHMPPPDYEPPMRHELAAKLRKSLTEAWRYGFTFGLLCGACFGSALTLCVLVIAIKWHSP